MENIIVVKNLHKSYFANGREIKVLKGLSLQVKIGEILAIVGPSGTGKSTLLHILGVLDRPTEGEVFWENNDINQLSDDELSHLRNEKVGFVFQFHHLLPEFTALENVSMPGFMHLNNEERKKVENRAYILLESVGLVDRVNHRPAELSGGEQQRVAVARALINNPEILLADEPTGNLDRENSEIVNDILCKLSKELGKTLVIVTHNENLAKKATRTIHLVDGKI